MRKLFFIAAAAATFFTTTGGTGAWADTFTHRVALSATADLACSFSGAPTPDGGINSATLSETSSELAVIFNADHGITAQSGSLTFSNVFCNGVNTTVALERQGLHHTVIGATTLPNFKAKIDYTVAVHWGTASNLVSLNESADEATVTVGPRSGNFVLEILVPASDGPFAAGTYSDSLTLTVQPTT